MKKAEEFYEKTKQKVDEQYRENETQYNDLMAQVQELENKPNKSEIEQVKLDILKAQNVQLNFREAKKVQERWEELKGNAVMDEFKYRSNAVRSVFISLVSGLIAGVATIAIFESASGLLSRHIDDQSTITIISAFALLIVLVFFCYIAHREEQKAQKDIARDMIKKYPDIFQGKIGIKENVKYGKIHQIMLEKIFKKRL